ncbi:MAG: isopenicillin N synthase family oxygenase [Sphingomonadales bacterium]|nr:isopenicillin N synthase family oxygenase [Sphingomonadales bacterium]
MNAASPVRLNERLCAKRESFDRIPVIDVAPLLDGSDRQGVARQIRWALANVGFMYVKGHGVPAQVVDEAFAMSARFFALPTDAKMKLHISHSDLALRGYIEPYGENTDPERTIDFKEVFDLGPERTTLEGPFFGPNLWPEPDDGFRAVIYGYHQRMVGLATALLRGIALSLDLPEDWFEGIMKNPISILRLLRYPPQTGHVREDVIGIGAHTDFGNLTILAQDEVGGLQVMNRDGAWVEGPPIPGAFVINIGDLVQKLSNDGYIANMHRVINISGRERYSIPFFIDADFDALIAPLPSCVSADNPARYPPVTCGAHKFGRFVDTYAHLAKYAG